MKLIIVCGNILAAVSSFILCHYVLNVCICTAVRYFCEINKYIYEVENFLQHWYNVCCVLVAQLLQHGSAAVGVRMARSV